MRGILVSVLCIAAIGIGVWAYVRFVSAQPLFPAGWNPREFAREAQYALTKTKETVATAARNGAGEVVNQATRAAQSAVHSAVEDITRSVRQEAVNALSNTLSATPSTSSLSAIIAPGERAASLVALAYPAGQNVSFLFTVPATSSYSVSWGDTAAESGALYSETPILVSHKWQARGTYAVTFTITGGAQRIATFTVAIY